MDVYDLRLMMYFVAGVGPVQRGPWGGDGCV